jgi:AraC-like DNA-binding protein
MAYGSGAWQLAMARIIHFNTVIMEAIQSALQQPLEMTANYAGTLFFKPYDISCINMAHTILLSDPTTRITNEELALKVGINRNKLHYGFKHVYGITINHFLEQQRMQKAELLLSTTYKSVKTIAAITGYCNSSRFVTVFKKTYGTTPYQYRKQQRLMARIAKAG